MIADAITGGHQAEAVLADLSARLALGVTRVPMSRQLGLSDVCAIAHVGRRAAILDADVLHGHGAKGGAYVRLANSRRAIRVYTPHGGSLHYRWGSPTGLLYLTLERILIARTDLFLFESVYGRDIFRAKLGDHGAMARWCTTGLRQPNSIPSPSIRGRPTWSLSASCASSRRRCAYPGDRSAQAPGMQPQCHRRG